jgi:hypothetical protein
MMQGFFVRNDVPALSLNSLHNLRYLAFDPYSGPYTGYPIDYRGKDYVGRGGPRRGGHILVIEAYFWG